MDRPTIYPDLTDIFAQKAAARRARAHRTFGDKIAMIEQLRERLAPLRHVRERRHARRQASDGESRRDERASN